MDEMCKGQFNSTSVFENDVSLHILQDYLPYIIASILVLVLIFGACFGPKLWSKCKHCKK